MTQQFKSPSAEHIMQIGAGFWASKILLSAVNLQLFTVIATHQKMSAAAIKSHMNFNCTDRHIYDFLDTLVGFNFLKRDGLLDTALYSNGIDVDFFLDKNKASYIGGMLEMLNNRLYGFWGNLEEGLRSGLPQNEAKNGGNVFDAIYADADVLKGFIHAMSGIQMGPFTAFAQKFDFSGIKTLVDIGGSAGLLSLMVAKHHAHMNCTTWEIGRAHV